MSEAKSEQSDLHPVTGQEQGVGSGWPGQLKPSDRASALDAVMQIPVTLKVVAGTATLPVSALSKLERGSLVPLDRQMGDKVDIVANGRVIARGEIVVIDGDEQRFGVSIEEVISRK